MRHTFYAANITPMFVCQACSHTRNIYICISFEIDRYTVSYILLFYTSKNTKDRHSKQDPTFQQEGCLFVYSATEVIFQFQQHKEENSGFSNLDQTCIRCH